MSGISLAVETRPDSDQKTEDVLQSLRVIDLQLAAFVTVFSASGRVPLFDLLFPAITSAYLLLLSRLAFPEHAGPTKKMLFQSSRLFRVYVIIGTVVGLVLPLAYVLGEFVRGDETMVRSAIPHLFLLSFQVLTENVVIGLGLFSTPVRVLVPMLYTVRRIFVLLYWIRDVWINKMIPPSAEIKDVAWCWFGRSLAVVNLSYFSINLFAFLIPLFLPRAFEQYFKDKIEMQSRSAASQNSKPSTSKKS